MACHGRSARNLPRPIVHIDHRVHERRSAAAVILARRAVGIQDRCRRPADSERSNPVPETVCLVCESERIDSVAENDLRVPGHGNLHGVGRAAIQVRLLAGVWLIYPSTYLAACQLAICSDRHTRRPCRCPDVGQAGLLGQQPDRLRLKRRMSPTSPRSPPRLALQERETDSPKPGIMATCILAISSPNRLFKIIVTPHDVDILPCMLTKRHTIINYYWPPLHLIAVATSANESGREMHRGRRWVSKFEGATSRS